MATAQKINGTHLKKARLFRGFSLSELSAKTEISKQTLSLYENENIKPEISKLIILADALRFPMDYFMASDEFNSKIEATYFRSLLSTSKMTRTTQSIRLEFIAHIYETLIDYVDFPNKNLPKIEFQGKKNLSDEEEYRETEEIEEIAKRCRKHWGLGNEPIKDLQGLLEANGIIVTSLENTENDVDAFSQKILIDNNAMFIVVLNANKSFVRARFDMAHELGHILLHPWSENIEELSKQEFKEREAQANKFAGAFLLPEDSFGADVSYYPTKLDYYVHLKKKWNVSVQAMIYRAHQLSLITTTQYQYLMRQVSKSGWRMNEPDDKPFEPKQTLLQEAVELLLSSGTLTPFAFMRSEESEDLLLLERNTLRGAEPKLRLITLKDN